MKIEVLPGKYILAVSGGVDSMALLDLLAKQAKSSKPKAQSQKQDGPSYRLSANGLQLVVAHFNHNIRPDAGEDEKLVQTAAAAYGLAYESETGELVSVSEEAARDARYGFLRRVQTKHKAKAVITAHHQDDLIETALLNLIRGSGRLGLSAITANKTILRPLLNTPKADLRDYASQHSLMWREDTTNNNTDYLRNYLRINILAGLTKLQRDKLIQNIDKVAKINIQLNDEIATLSHILGDRNIDRNDFSKLSANIGNELVAHVLRRANIHDFDSKTVNRLSMAIKTAQPNSSHHIKQNSTLRVSAKTANFVTP
jgi:tRNA(Ile)-lysidine synthase